VEITINENTMAEELTNANKNCHTGLVTNCGGHAVN